MSKEGCVSMKTTMNKFFVRLIPLFLIFLALIGTMTDFRAQMLEMTVVTGENKDESEEVFDLSAVNVNSNTYIRTSSSRAITPSNRTAAGTSATVTAPNVYVKPQPGQPNPVPGLMNPLTGYINPLTGLYMKNDVSKNRPVAVSVSNSQPALPSNATNGISQADIVHEVLVEGGITRFIALFQDFADVGVVGSIRSARHYTVELAEAYDALFIHAGGSPLGFEEIERRNITNFDEVKGVRSQIFKRDVNRVPGHTVQNYHSVTTSGASYDRWISTYGLRLTHGGNYNRALNFTGNPIPNGDRAHNAVVRFSAGKSSTFAYNETQNLYYMNQFGSQFRDANNNDPVTFTNLLILDMPVADLVGHGEGSGRQHINTVGSGKGYFASGGRYVRINWYRADKSSQFIYTYENGSIIELGVGKTYIGIVPPDMVTSFN